jgi:hypothetical protein
VWNSYLEELGRKLAKTLEPAAMASLNITSVAGVFYQVADGTA